MNPISLFLILFFGVTHTTLQVRASEDPCGLGIQFNRIESYSLWAYKSDGPTHTEVYGVTKDDSRAPYYGHLLAMVDRELSITYTGGIVGNKKDLNDGVKFRLGYKTKPEGDRWIPLETQNFDPKSAYNSIRGTLKVPRSESGVMEIWFEAILPSGEIKYDSKEGGNYRFRLIPNEAPRDLCFDRQWNERVANGPIKAGDVLRIHYDAYRILERLEGTTYNGHPAYTLYGYVKFVDHKGETIDIIDFPIESIRYTSGPSIRRPVAGLVPVPSNAKKAVFWFKGSGRGRPLYESDFGDDYQFPVE